MTTQDLSRQILEGDDNFPEAVRAQIEASPELQALYEQTRTVRNLLSLKNYEQPPAGFETRVRQDIMRRIRMGSEAETSLLKRVWAFLAGPAWPVLRYAGATAVVAVAAILIFSQPAAFEQQASEPEPAAPALPEAPVVVPLRLAEPAPTKDPAVRMVTLPSTTNTHRGTDRIQYGPMPSVPVSTDPLP